MHARSLGVWWNGEVSRGSIVLKHIHVDANGDHGSHPPPRRHCQTVFSTPCPGSHVLGCLGIMVG
jgi:hypothetical protein